MWNFYTASGYIGKFKTIKECMDIALESLYEELELINRHRIHIYNNPECLLINPEILEQPFPNNEHIGNHTGGMFNFLNQKELCIFKLPDENTKMHIIALTHISDETHYLIKSDVSAFYFGDKSWDDYNNA
jgi:hypothetical protein